MGHILPTTLFIKVALCLVWSRPRCVLFLTLLSVLKICAVLLISDVLFMIPRFFQGLSNSRALSGLSNDNWAGQFPVWPRTCRDSKILSCPILTGVFFVRDIWVHCSIGRLTALHAFAGSPNFEINHAFLEVCHHKQMQNWRSQFVFRVAGYCRIWRVEIIYETFLQSAVQGSEFGVFCVHLDNTLYSFDVHAWSPLLFLVCVIMNYQNQPNLTKQNYQPGSVRMKLQRIAVGFCSVFGMYCCTHH